MKTICLQFFLFYIFVLPSYADCPSFNGKYMCSNEENIEEISEVVLQKVATDASFFEYKVIDLKLSSSPIDIQIHFFDSNRSQDVSSYLISPLSSGYCTVRNSLIVSVPESPSQKIEYVYEGDQQLSIFTYNDVSSPEDLLRLRDWKIGLTRRCFLYEDFLPPEPVSQVPLEKVEENKNSHNSAPDQDHPKEEDLVLWGNSEPSPKRMRVESPISPVLEQRAKEFESFNQKKHSFRLTQKQHEELKSSFLENQYLSTFEKEALADKTRLSPKQIAINFQHQRKIYFRKKNTKKRTKKVQNLEIRSSPFPAEAYAILNNYYFSKKIILPNASQKKKIVEEVNQLESNPKFFIDIKMVTQWFVEQRSITVQQAQKP